MPEPEPERYVTIDLALLDAIREGRTLPAIRLLVRVATIDRVSNHLVIGVRVVRDLDDRPEGGAGPQM
jgi:hypothetical protein